MLHQITWPQYLLFVGVGLLVYYSIIWLLYFSGKSADTPAGKQPQPGKENARPFGEADDNDLLGQPADEYGVSTIDSDELNFGPAAGEEEFFEDEELNEGEYLPRFAEEQAATTGETDNDELLQGDIADLLEDVKPVFHFIREHDPEDRNRLIELAANKLGLYPRLLQSELLKPVLQEICDNALSELDLAISPEELEAKINYDQDLGKAVSRLKGSGD